jgi:long-chain alkane monooxygenase
MHINVFSMATPSPLFEGLWRHPEDHSAQGYRSLDYWTSMARKLESACIDALFFADYHGIWDVYGSSWKPAVRRGVTVPSVDPTLILPAAAAVTRHLGLAVTLSTTYYQPYECARVFSSLDHLTGGRVGWNIVTSCMKSAQDNGLGEFLEHDLRYDRADEYLQVVRKLWEESWEDGAVVHDAENDVFADPERVHEINHEGNWFSVRGPFQCEPSPQRVPVLYQAGASPRGQAFAAKHSEAVFLPLPNPEDGAHIVAGARKLIAQQGRDPHSVKMLLGCNVLVGRDHEDAQAKADTYVNLSSPEGQLVRWCLWTDLDLAGYPGDYPVSQVGGHGTRSFVEYLKSISPDKEWTIDDVKAMVARVQRPGPEAPNTLFGTPGEVADQMERWMTVAGVDGFNLYPCPPTSGIDDICELLVPELQRRGMFRTAYDPAERTLRERYFGPGAVCHR